MESWEEMSRGLQIASNTALNGDEFPMLGQQENMNSGCSTDTVIASIARYGANRENTYDSEETQRRINEEKTGTECISDCELLEHQYWEHLEPKSKLNHPRKARPLEHEIEQKNLTYRKLDPKEKVERKLPSSYYKLDKPTTHMLEKLLDVRSLEQYQEVIGKGRNCVVISAGFTNVKHNMPSFCLSFLNAAKIYKLSNDENINKVIYKRTAREFEQLKLLRKPCLLWMVPHPVSYDKNILVMSMVGTSEEPALPLTSISPELYHDTYDTIVENMKYFYWYLNVVHGKLCAKNILIWRNKPFYVGWSHSIWKGEPSAPKKLMKDCNFVTKFFKTRNVPVISTEVLLKYISSAKEISPDVLDVIHNKEPSKVKCHGNPNRGKPVNTSSGNYRFK